MLVTYQLDINAPIGVVFDFLDDDQKLKLWIDGLEETSYPDGQDQVNPIGTKFKQRIREGGRVVEYDGEVTDYVKPTFLGIRIGNRQFTLQVDYRLNATATGTRLNYKAEAVGASWLVKLLGKLFSPFTRRILDKQMKRLKRLAEAERQFFKASA